MLHVDPRNPAAAKLTQRLRDALPDIDKLEIEIVVGGDGFMLHTIEVGEDRTWLGLNAGRIGFLMNDTDAWEQVIQHIKARAWTCYSFPVLIAEATQQGQQTTLHALNDVVVERRSGQTAHLRLEVDGRVVVERLVADGIVISTALGSTAYTFSAGGAAAHPLLSLLAVTAAAAHHPRLSPFLLPDTARIRVDVLDAFRRPVRIVADGADLNDVERVEIYKGPHQVRLAWLDGHDHTSRIVRKILRP